MAARKRKNIVVIGGGTGTFTVLSGLKKHPFNLAAIVTMSDDGGSTGMLRDELGVLPPGDVRTCLVALSSSDKLMRTLMNYRFDNGKLKGHSFGNLLLSALEKITGSFDEAVEKAGEVLRIRGRVIPATLDEVRLMAQVGSRLIRGEEKIQNSTLNGSLKYLWLEPVARANPKALRAIREADLIVIGPGNFYASLVPNLLVRGLPEAIRKSKAKKVFICNLMTKMEHTHGWNVADYVNAVEKYLGGPVDVVVYNNKKPDTRMLKKYAREGDTLTSWDELPEGHDLVGSNLMSRHAHVTNKIGTPAKESSLVRHDPSKLANILIKVLGGKKKKK
ncbi:MAG TPA: gluconeogenesis factor YvcK family protein [Candidatus Paceibacterota bacterium]|nr:gluconeogenesis factor YvcK family protein [Candidatus Paceibacterota bacterium]